MRHRDGPLTTLLLAALLGLAMIFQSAGAAEQQDCPLKQYASLELGESADGDLLVPVTFDGRAAYMKLDTASPFSGITEEAANVLGLASQRVPGQAVVHYGGMLIAHMATTKTFALGSLRYADNTFLIIPASLFGHPVGDVPLVGSLGMDVLGRFDVELDVSRRKLNLFASDPCPRRAVYWSKTYDAVPIRVGKVGELYFPMTLDGQKVETTIATGNEFTTVFDDVARTVYHVDKSSPDVEKRTSPDGATTSYFRMMTVTSAALQVMNAQVRLKDHHAPECHVVRTSGSVAYEGCYGTHPLQLGRSILTKLRIFIATKEKLLYFTLADAHD